MAGDGLRVFFGEFGILPVPLELSGNWCSHSCSYCFANAAVPQRQLDLRSVMSLLSNMDKRTGLDARLLRMRYPVNISNHVDPFSESNHKHMVPIMELMTGLDIPIYFQTRGGNEGAIAKTLDFIKPSVFYVSITHDNETTRELIEPNAPTIAHRLEFLRELKRRGHRLLVGLNPLVPEWWEDIDKMLLTLKEIGVEGFWIETFHLNYRQRSGLKSWQKKRLGEPLIKKAMKIFSDPEHEEFWAETRNKAIAMGFEVMTAGQPGVNGFYDPFHETYSATFPTMQGFVNYCAENEARLITWDDWRDYFLPRLPKVGASNQHIDYIRQAVHLELSKKFNNLTRKTKFNYHSVLQSCYRYEELKKIPLSPWRHPCFVPVRDDGRTVYRDKDGALDVDVKKGLPVFMFDVTGSLSAVELGD